MNKECSMSSLRSNIGLGDDLNLFYMRVGWQMEREREIAIKRGQDLDEKLKQLRDEPPNIALRG